MRIVLIYICALVIGICAYGVFLYANPQTLSPDGEMYLKRDPPYPYRLRFLLPSFLSTQRQWALVTGTCLVLTPPAITAYATLSGLPPARALVAGALFVGLTGVFRANVILPVLVDAPALLGAVVAACLMLSGHPLLALLVAFVAAGVKETAPLFAAAFSLSFLPLIALVVPLAVYLLRGHPVERTKALAENGMDYLATPLKSAWVKHSDDVLDARRMLLPWGACLLALFSPLWIVAAISSAISYSQLAVGMDLSRLYQWSAPAVCVSAALIIPEQYAVPILIAHFYNPYKSVV